MSHFIRLNLAKYFPVSLDFVAYKPQSVVFSLTNRCNCHCVMCDYWKLPADNEASTAEVEDILKQARQLGVEGCLFYGGEPYMREDLCELLAFASSLGQTTGIITNGILVDESKARSSVAAGLGGVAVSIDACDETQDGIRGVKDAYEKDLQRFGSVAMGGIPSVTPDQLGGDYPQSPAMPPQLPMNNIGGNTKVIGGVTYVNEGGQWYPQ